MSKSYKPAHQNRVAFKHNKKSVKSAKIMASPIEGLCRRCHEKIEWRKKYRKYKPLTAPKKCENCREKRVKRAYHLLCDPCAKSLHVCAKCKQSDDIITPMVTEEEKRAMQAATQYKIDCMTEAQRRTYYRTQKRLKRQAKEEGGEEEEDDDDYDEEDGEDDGEEDDGENDVNAECGNDDDNNNNNSADTNADNEKETDNDDKTNDNDDNDDNNDNNEATETSSNKIEENNNNNNNNNNNSSSSNTNELEKNENGAVVYNGVEISAVFL